MSRLASLLLPLIVAVPAAQAQEPAERLTLPLPAQFRHAGQMKSPGGSLVQIYRPAGQTDENWTTQLILQTTANTPHGEPAGLLRVMEKLFDKACPEHEPMKILPGKTNGYATATTMYKCPLDPAAAKPETSMIHAISGTDKMYVIQQTVRAALAPDQVKQMIAYLGTVKLCDGRTAEHPCPAAKAP